MAQQQFFISILQLKFLSFVIKKLIQIIKQNMHSYQQENFQGEFNDSLVIHPIQMKSNINIVPSFLHRGNPQHTTLATYDKLKLSQFLQLEHLAEGEVMNILTIDSDSLIVNITRQGTQFFQKYSSNDISFIAVVGDNQSGKSFFFDKILNLANINGNHFCETNNNKPGINVWSIPFVKEQLKIFLLQVSNCSTNSLQFKALAPYIAILSSAVINLNHYNKQINRSNGDSRHTIFQNVMSQVIQSIVADNQNQKIPIFPEFYYNLNRQVKDKTSQNQIQQQNLLIHHRIRTQQEYLPDAMTKGYSGSIQDLKSHSFLNKRCISEDYIMRVSQIFQKVYSKINQKKYRQLIFNGNIVLKLLRYVEALLNKNKKIQLDLIYQQIVKDLYISAYNYCVISYHQQLQKALQNEEPHSLESLIGIFQNASNQVLEKYNQFTLDPQCHRSYQQKLFQHIESKQRLILEINRKKTQVEIQKIIQKTDMSNIQTAWQNIKAINQNQRYKHLNHGKSKVIGQNLNKILANTKNSNNIDYRVLKQIQKLKTSIKQREAQLKVTNQKNKQANQMQFKINQERKGLQNSLKSLQQKIRVINRDIKIYSNNQVHNIEDLTDQKNKLDSKYQRNQKILEQLRGSQNPQTQKVQKEKTRQIQAVISKQRLLQTTLQDLQKEKGANAGQKQKQVKEAPQRQKQSKVKKQTIMKKQQSSSSKINQSKKMKNSKK